MTTLKVFYDLDNTVFDIIDAADENGRTHFVVPAHCLPTDVNPWSQDGLDDMLDSALNPHGLFVSSSKTWPKAIEAKQTKLENGDCLVGFNAAKFFLLPGLKPREELAELRGLFEVMKNFFLAHANASSPVMLSLMNNRDSHGRVYGTYKVVLKDGEEDADIGPQLDERIKASPVLQQFQRNYALALDKVGRYSWLNLTENNFFRAGARPWELAFLKRHIEEAHKLAGASSTNASC